MNIAQWGGVAKDTFLIWRRSHSSLLAAAVAYFSLISLVPLLVISLYTGGYVFGDSQAMGGIFHEIRTIAGPPMASLTQSLVRNAGKSGVKFAGAVGIAILLIAASAVFRHLQLSLYILWDVETRYRVTHTIWSTLLSFIMVLTAGPVLVGFFLLNAGLGVIQSQIQPLIPGELPVWTWKAANSLTFFLAFWILCAAFYRITPGARLTLRQAWRGGGVTAGLVTLGVWGIGSYFRFGTLRAIFGASGVVAAFMIWVYLSALLFLVGAAFTQAYARRSSGGN